MNNLVDKAKQLAAYAAVDNHMAPLFADSKRDQKIVLGIGSGSTIVFAVDRLFQVIQERKIDSSAQNCNFVCIPTSFQARQLILDKGLPLGDLEQYPRIDVTIDGADEVDSEMNCIKGGGGCQTQEKIVAFNSKSLVIIADYRKKSPNNLGNNWKQGVPLEVLPLAYKPVMFKLREMGGNPVIRMAKSKAGPCITDNGNMVIDVDFGLIKDPATLNANLKQIPGIVETGLFVSMAQVVYFGMEDGTVSKMDK